jgi:hypothetical protein
MMSSKTWKIVQFAACLSLVGAACGTQEGTGTDDIDAPATGSPAPGSGAAAGKPASGSAGAGTAGKSAASAGSSSAGKSGAAGTSGGSGATSAVAVLAPFMGGGTSTGAAGSSGGAAGSTSSGAAGQPAKAGTGGSSTGAAGSGGKAGTGGTGTGAGIAAVSGTATFTKAAGTQIDVAIEITGCEDGKSYPVHIHEGTSCESAATQGGHWGAPQAFEISAAGAGGSAAGGMGGSSTAAAGSGAAGHDASHAAGSGAGPSVAGSGAAGSGAAGGPAVSFKYRGEGIPDIACKGTTGTTEAKRNTFDKRVIWSIGSGDETDVVGHVVVVHDGADRIACGVIEAK